MGKKQSDVYNHLAGERSIFGIHLSTSFTAEWLHITYSLQASLPLSTGVSAISSAIINTYLVKDSVQRYKNYSIYAPIRKKIFLKGHILRSFEVLIPHQSVIMPPYLHVYESSCRASDLRSSEIR